MDCRSRAWLNRGGYGGPVGCVGDTVGAEANASASASVTFGSGQSAKPNRHPNKLPTWLEDKIAAAKAEIAAEAAAATDAASVHRVRIKFGNLQAAIDAAKKRQKYKRWALVAAGVGLAAKFLIF